jgi:hypothetical protein
MVSFPKFTSQTILQPIKKSVVDGLSTPTDPLFFPAGISF